jgi:hypothetical protein
MALMGVELPPLSKPLWHNDLVVTVNRCRQILDPFWMGVTVVALGSIDRFGGHLFGRIFKC